MLFFGIYSVPLNWGIKVTFKKKGIMAEVKTKPITPELRKLKLGESIVYPIEQHSSVMSVISRLRKELIRNHWDVRTETDTSRYEVKVSRIS
jgi:hypothetical protein|nr:MAG TPA: hypothetical protein [Caudoviricetes sp.]